jgi:alpha/beta superfamily hydrolase
MGSSAIQWLQVVGELKRSERLATLNRPIFLRRADPLPHTRIPRGRTRHPCRNRNLVLDLVTTLSITTSDGEQLEVIHDGGSKARGAIVLCHPHPQHGGTMRAPMLGAIAKHAVAEGFDVVRFNFRGVGASTGIHGDGDAELQDVDAAMAYASGLDMPVAGMAGWSFGAAVCLNWQAQTASAAPYVGIAPPVRSPLTPPLPDPSRLVPARRAFVIGEKDQFIPADELAVYAESIKAGIIRYRGTDHFFVLKHTRLAEDVVDLIGG